MKNMHIGQFNEVLIINTIRVSPYAYVNEAPIEIHDSVSVVTTEVKNHGEGLLIVLQEATLMSANPRTTTVIATAHVVPLPFGNTPTDLHVFYSYSYKMSP